MCIKETYFKGETVNLLHSLNTECSPDFKSNEQKANCGNKHKEI